MPAKPSPTSPLRLSAVRQAFRLIGEVREIGHDPHAWRLHLVRRLCSLATAEGVVSSEFHFVATKSPGVMRMIEIGWGADVDGHTWEIRSERDDERPESYKLVPLAAERD